MDIWGKWEEFRQIYMFENLDVYDIYINIYTFSFIFMFSSFHVLSFSHSLSNNFFLLLQSYFKGKKMQKKTSYIGYFCSM